jgi:hypothetical protein
VFVDTLDLDLTNDSIEDVVTVKDRILLSSIQECCVVGDHHDPTGISRAKPTSDLPDATSLNPHQPVHHIQVGISVSAITTTGVGATATTYRFER